MKDAFDDIVRQYQSPVRRFFLNLTLGDSQLSDDLAQDTFVKAFLHYDSFRGQASLQTWLMRIAYNVFYDYTRSRSKGQGARGKEQEMSPGIENTLAPCSLPPAPELKMDIYAALALLKPDERTCITLQLVDGYDIQKIAVITGLKEGTVKSHLSRGKEKLANYLRKNGYEYRR